MRFQEKRNNTGSCTIGHYGWQEGIEIQNFSIRLLVKKHIWEIEKEDGSLVKDQQEIKNEAVQYYKRFYKASSTVNIEEQCKLIDLFPLMVAEEEANTLYNPVTLEELKHMLFQCKK
jgi:hypothetical protein